MSGTGAAHRAASGDPVDDAEGNAQARSPYHASFRRTIEHYDRLVRRARSPDVVARVIEWLLSRRRLAPRYLIGSPAEVLAVGLKSHLPPRSFEYIFRKAYRL